jgi:hypothetical protein
VHIVELTTSESFATYEEAKRRVDSIPAEVLVGIPFIFEELPDGSQRLVREDGKPLQWHRLPDDRPPGPDDPLPLCDDSADVLSKGGWVPITRPEPEEEG